MIEVVGGIWLGLAGHHALVTGCEDVLEPVEILEEPLEILDNFTLGGKDPSGDVWWRRVSVGFRQWLRSCVFSVGMVLGEKAGPNGGPREDPRSDPTAQRGRGSPRTHHMPPPLPADL